jgi:hypothetical protein
VILATRVNLAKDEVHRHKGFCTKDLPEPVDLVDLLTTPVACCAPARRAFPTGPTARTRPLKAVVLGWATTGSPAAGWLRSIGPKQWYDCAVNAPAARACLSVP